MRTTWIRRVRRLTLVLGCGMSFALGSGCQRMLQRELEVLFQPQASPFLLHDSFLVNTFGPGIIKLFNR